MKKNFPKFKNEYIYHYKTIESNPEVKSEFAIYALNNSKVIKSFSNSNDSTMKNSYCKIKNYSKFKNDNLISEKNNKNSSKFIAEENNKFNKILMTEESFDFDLEENEIEDNEDFQEHIKDIVLRQNNIKNDK